MFPSLTSFLGIVGAGRSHRCRAAGERRQCRSPTAGSLRLTDRREGRRDQQLVFLADRPYPALRWPGAAGGARGGADAVALGEILVDPGVDELVEPAELASPARCQRRELLSRRNPLRPGLQHFPQVTASV